MLTLNIFVNKICTVFSQNSGFPFKDGVQYSNYFTGRVEQIDENGIWLRQPHIDTLAFYPFPVTIIEEQYLPEDTPEAIKIKEELTPKPPKPMETFIPIEEFTKMVKKSK